jgi:hypothetical protein
MFTRIRFQIATSIRESIPASEVAFQLLYLWVRIRAMVGSEDGLLELACRIHRWTRRSKLRESLEKIIEPRVATTYQHRATREAAKQVEASFGGWIRVLKEPREGEKGVLFVMFSESLRRIREGMDVEQLLMDYQLVVEPSWSGYCDPDFLYFTQFSDPIFILAAEQGDFEFLTRLDTNLIPVPLGPCDWVNPGIAEPFVGSPKRFDIVMNANWGPAKRHHVLFKLLSDLEQPLEVALIGGPWGGGTKDAVLKLADQYGVRHNLTVFETIPYEKVMEVTAASRISILLSRKEGSNRALAESIFCDVPVVLLDEHVGGIRKNVVAETGWIVPERELASMFMEMLNTAGSMSPRAWALEHISHKKSGDFLNQFLRESSAARGLPWSRDLVDHSNSPDVTYECSPAEEESLRAANARLGRYLIDAN